MRALSGQTGTTMSGNNAKYQTTTYTVGNLLNYINTDEIAVPDIQRPFVWQGKQVRDLVDSLYNGYPTGYLIIWQNPTVKLKDGSEAGGKKLLIDGQQRVTALMTAIAGEPVLNSNYRNKRIAIAFNPLATDDEERFQVKTAAHGKSSFWVPDIAAIFSDDFDSYEFVQDYVERNEGCNSRQVNAAIQRLLNIRSVQLGAIVLDPGLSIDEVTEIFVRVNSRGKVLNEADFAMSKIAADDAHGGHDLRKAIDYFCHLAADQTFYQSMTNDTEFMESPYAGKISWLKDGLNSIYQPDYSDMLRVSFMHRFHQGKLATLVGKLSGRDYDLRTYREEVIDESFDSLSQGVLEFVSKYNFDNFTLALKGAGFVDQKLARSQMTLDFAYALSLFLRDEEQMGQAEIKSAVAKWFVLTTLTGRYSGSPESWMDRDLRSLASTGYEETFTSLESAAFSESYWENTLPTNLQTTSSTSPYMNVFLAAQCFFDDRSFLSPMVKVSHLITHAGDVHHIFPRAYLRKNGFDDKNVYNQVANYTYLDTGVNIEVGEKAPHEYLGEVLELCRASDGTGPWKSEQWLMENLEANCIPSEVIGMGVGDYQDFLQMRRTLMARKIKLFYESL